MAENRKPDQENLKNREYKDAQGNVHHHTKEYMEGHGGKSSERRNEERGSGEQRGQRK